MQLGNAAFASSVNSIISIFLPKKCRFQKLSVQLSSPKKCKYVTFFANSAINISFGINASSASGISLHK